MTIMNKYVLSGHKFHLNLFLLTIQSTTSVIFLMLCKKANLLTYRPLNRPDATIWLPVSLLLVAMIYTSSKSLQYLTVAIFTIFKNITIVCIALGEQRIFQSSITSLMWTSFALIILSSVVGAINDISFNLRGYIWMLINCAVSATYILYMRLSIRRVDFADFDSVYYNNMLAIPVMAILSITTENWSEFYADYYGDGPLVGSRNALFVGMVASSLAAFAISYSTAWSVRVASSTTYSMVGALNKLPVALSGILFFPRERHVVNGGNIVSVMIAFASGVVYSVAQIQQRNKKTIVRNVLIESPPDETFPLQVTNK